MFRPLSCASVCRRYFGSGSGKKVALLGASGGIGQPLALQLKLNARISRLSLYDIKQAGTPCKGVAADVRHVNTRATVEGYAGDEELQGALEGSDVVVMTAGVPRKPGMTRDDLFSINAGIVKGLASAAAKHCPSALLLIISNPVNSTVPIAAEIYKKAGCYDWRKILGVTTLDCLRANTFVAEQAGLNPSEVSVPVIGGHAGLTILPVLSQVSPKVSLSSEVVKSLDYRIQNAGTEVVEAKGGAGSATLSMAFAAAAFTDSVLKGLEGEIAVECTYIGNQDDTGYFAWPVLLGRNGVEEVRRLSNLTAYEETRLTEAKAQLQIEIEKGQQFAKN